MATAFIEIQDVQGIRTGIYFSQGQKKSKPAKQTNKQTKTDKQTKQSTFM